MDTIQTDIVVIGAGSAGVAAAIAAAETKSVILIEKISYSGGKATAAEVGTICGLYHFSKSPESKFVVGGFAKKFAEELATISNTTAIVNHLGLHYLPYKIDAFKNLCESLLNKPKVKTYYNTELISIHKDGDTITSINANYNNKEFKIICKAVVDCSGDAIVSKVAGIPVIEDEKYQAASQVFTVGGIREMSEPNLTLLLMKELRSAVMNKFADSDFEKVYLVNGSFKNGTASFKLTIPLSVTNHPNNLEKLRSTAIERINQFVMYFQKHVSAFVHAQLNGVAPEVGVRVGARGLGRYILTEEDVLTCKKFDNAIANGAWPIEKWNDNVKVEMIYLRENDYYQIPTGCLHSSHISNLFFGGRIISATENAIASARVMGTCLQTGYAAGKLAAEYS